MESWASVDRFQGDDCERSTDTAGLSGPGQSRAGSEPAAATMASLQKEITRLLQTTESLRELAYTQRATNRRLTNAKDPVQRLPTGYKSPPPQLDLTESQPRQAANGGPRLIAEPLTRTEEAVLRRLTTMLSLSEISRERNVSRDTIKGQARAIYRKLGVSNRHEAVQRGRELGLLTRRKGLSSALQQP